MKVLERCGTNRHEDRFTLEDWSEDWDFEHFPNLRPMSYCVACFALANEKYPFYPMWTRFRVDINFESLEEATDCFRNLIEGKKKIADYKEHVYQKEKLEQIRQRG